MRFVPGKVYKSTATQLTLLCLAEEKQATDVINRTVYYVILRSSDGTVEWSPFSVGVWKYTPMDPINYPEVEE